MQIRMEGRDAANNWKHEAEGLNERTEKLLTDVSNLLKSVRDFSEGTLVDEIYDVGTSLVTATTRLMEGMNKIYDVVNGLLDLFTNFITGASNSTRNVRSTIE